MHTNIAPKKKPKKRTKNDEKANSGTKYSYFAALIYVMKQTFRFCVHTWPEGKTSGNKKYFFFLHISLFLAM